MAKRRPGRDPEMDQDKKQEAAAASPTPVSVVDVETGIQAQPTVSDVDATAAESSAQATSASEAAASSQVEIKFKGSEILRAKFPAPFEVAEKVATDWVNGGRFEGLPLGHPLAQYFAAKGLRKAKQLEKKVLESPVTEKLAMQALTAGMKAQEIINQVREKVKK